MMAVLETLRRPVHTIGLYIVFAPHAASVFNDASGPLGGMLLSLYL